MIVQSNWVTAEPSERTEPSQEALCRYINRTPQMQIVRVANVPHFCFERTVLPGKQVVFNARPEAELEVHTHSFVTAILTARIRCDRLQMRWP
ncbi:MAG: DUF1830 domain-containing protein [Thermosynechococcaceae cyanobacterium]